MRAEQLITQYVEAITVDDDDIMSKADAHKFIKGVIMSRKGDVIDDKLAHERTNNIVTSLSGYYINTK